MKRIRDLIQQFVYSEFSSIGKLVEEIDGDETCKVVAVVVTEGVALKVCLVFTFPQ